jgi:hypothetical protein
MRWTSQFSVGVNGRKITDYYSDSGSVSTTMLADVSTSVHCCSISVTAAATDIVTQQLSEDGFHW